MSITAVSSEAVLESRPVQVLRRAIDGERLAHGILLYGDFLEALEIVMQDAAGQLLKTEKPALHPDFYTLRPRGKSRQITIGTQSERSGGQWPPNTMRRLIHDLQHSASGGGNKVAVVYEADRMNKATQNAFLKTLEEPPRDTTIFLLTTRAHSLLPTIRSRVFNFRIPGELIDFDNADWLEWTEDYRHLVQKLCTKPSRSPAEPIMTAYGLVTRFETILAASVKERWEAQKDQLGDDLEEDQVTAIQTSLAKSLRQRLFGDVEMQTRNAIVVGETTEAEFAKRMRKLQSVLEELEHLHTLVDVFNLKESAALEQFFLRSLRIWSAK